MWEKVWDQKFYSNNFSLTYRFDLFLVPYIMSSLSDMKVLKTG